MSQFKDPQFEFYNGDTAKNPVVVFPPPQWYAQQKATPTIPHIIGIIAIAFSLMFTGLATLYTLFEAGSLLVKAFSSMR